MKSDYQAYLIRFQRGKGQITWRVRLENASNGEVLHFGTEQKLIHYLLTQLSVSPMEEASTEFDHEQY